MTKKIVLDVFGRRMLAERDGRDWRMYSPGPDGKRRPVSELAIPRDITTPAALVRFLDDHFHEFATPSHPAVRVVG